MHSNGWKDKNVDFTIYQEVPRDTLVPQELQHAQGKRVKQSLHTSPEWKTRGFQR